MNKAKLFWKLIIPMVLLISNTAFSQDIKFSSISTTNQAFVLTIPKDVAKETPEKVLGQDFDNFVEGDFDVNKLMSYPKWTFQSMTITSKNPDGTIKEEQYYIIYNTETNKYLRYSNKDSKLKMVSVKDYDEINKKKENSFDYIQPFKVRCSFWFKLRPTGDYVKLSRCSPTSGSVSISSKWSLNPIRLILVENK